MRRSLPLFSGLLLLLACDRGLTPEESFHRLVTAYLEHDSAAVAQHIDVPRVAESIVDQLADGSEALERFVPPDFSGDAEMITGLIEQFRPMIVQLLATAFWEGVTEESDGSSGGSIADMLGERGPDFAALAELRFTVEYSELDNPYTILGVEVGGEDGETILIDVQMERMAGGYRMVGIANLADTIADLTARGG